MAKRTLEQSRRYKRNYRAKYPERWQAARSEYRKRHRDAIRNSEPERWRRYRRRWNANYRDTKPMTFKQALEMVMR